MVRDYHQLLNFDRSRNDADQKSCEYYRSTGKSAQQYQSLVISNQRLSCLSPVEFKQRPKMNDRVTSRADNSQSLVTISV